MTDLITSSFLPLLCCCFPCFRKPAKDNDKETDEQALQKAAEWRKRLSARDMDMEAAVAAHGGAVGGRSRGGSGSAPYLMEEKRRSAASTDRGSRVDVVVPVSERWREAGSVIGVEGGGKK